MEQQTVSKNYAYRLITIPISHYCEKVRWALDWLQIPYVEERHVPFFHRLATVPQGGKSVPVLVTPEGAFVDSTEILHYLDAKTTGSQRLYPTESAQRCSVEDLEELFDTQLGVHTRRWAYFYGLNNRQRLRVGWCEGTPQVEQVGFAIAHPLMSSIVKRAFNVTAASATSSLQEIKQIFETVDRRLSDDRPYLVGDNFSAADLTFAALAAPVLQPPEHPVKLPQVNSPNREMVTTVKELRSTRAGAHALRLYREQRSR